MLCRDHSRESSCAQFYFFEFFVISFFAWFFVAAECCHGCCLSYRRVANSRSATKRKIDPTPVPAGVSVGAPIGARVSGACGGCARAAGGCVWSRCGRASRFGAAPRSLCVLGFAFGGRGVPAIIENVREWSLRCSGDPDRFVSGSRVCQVPG